MIKIPEGWREIEIGETIVEGDKFNEFGYPYFYEFGSSVGKTYCKNFHLLTGEPVRLAITQRPKPMNTNNLTNSLTINKDKVIAAANKCPQAKEVLKTLFPEVFDSKEVEINDEFIKNRIGVRLSGKLAFKSIYLDPKYNWEIVKDDEDEICLVPTNKV